MLPAELVAVRAGVQARRSSAFHEAGHVVVERHFGQQIISAEIARDGGGRTVVRDVPHRRLGDTDAAAAMAGLVAATLAVEHTKHAAATLARLERGFGRGIGGVDAVSDLERVRRIIGNDDARYRDLMRRTFVLVERPDMWRQVEAVASALLARGRLEERQIDDLLQRSRLARR